MRTLLIDNHDSYTFNLFQLLAAVNGHEPQVIVNDDPVLATLAFDDFDNIVISPGPGHPGAERNLGQIGRLLARATLPVLGVCLGHQALAYLAGGLVNPAPQPRHGFLARIKHDDDELFADIPNGFTAVRYHSLRVDQPLPPQLTAIAWAEDGVIMALRHTTLPRWGVQFHPESVATEYGRELLGNFRELTPAAGRAGQRRRRPVAAPLYAPSLQLLSTALHGAVDTERAFVELFSAAPDCFWLDSSRAEPGLSRFSFLGDASGPLSEVLTYRLVDGLVSTRRRDGVSAVPGSAFDLLDQRLRERRIADPGLPFDFTGGYVGYFGYEMKADCGAVQRHRARTPDAAWIFADRLVVVDHRDATTYVLAVHDASPATRTAAEDWIAATATRLRLLPAADPSPTDEPDDGEPVDARQFLVRGRRQYLQNINECQRQLALGESYEICLTDTARLPFADDDVAFYRRLRRANPAPYAALLRIDDVAVFSSSPERFLRLRGDGTVETRPIKGTAPRADDPVRDAELAAGLAADPKTRAEHLMIVDLLRNDLGRVCEVGSVAVDRFMAVESYATVHQLVSTISGRLREAVSAVRCVRQCFPGGSMTGAPKLRTMEIIDGLETEARGVYSGTLGYFGLAGGADLSIVIRTAVRSGGELSIGAGGAIVLDSDPLEEFAEMLLKANAPLRAYRR